MTLQTSTPQTFARLTLFFATGLLLLGCQPDGRAPAKAVIVKGKVTLDDKPLIGARVTFIPLMPPDASLVELRPMSFGLTTDEGLYSLSQADGTAGAITGQHTVLISKPIESALGDEETNAVPEFYRQHGYLKRHVMPMTGSQPVNFDLSTIDPLLRD